MTTFISSSIGTPMDYVAKATFRTNVFSEPQYTSASVVLATDIRPRYREDYFTKIVLSPSAEASLSGLDFSSCAAILSSSVRAACHSQSWAMVDVIILDLLLPDCRDDMGLIYACETAMFMLLNTYILKEGRHTSRIPWSLCSTSLYLIDNSHEYERIQSLRKDVAEMPREKTITYR